VPELYSSELIGGVLGRMTMVGTFGNEQDGLRGNAYVASCVGWTDSSAS
jgi:hypothetical protein